MLALHLILTLLPVYFQPNRLELDVSPATQWAVSLDGRYVATADRCGENEVTVVSRTITRATKQVWKVRCEHIFDLAFDVRSTVLLLSNDRGLMAFDLGKTRGPSKNIKVASRLVPIHSETGDTASFLAFSRGGFSYFRVDIGSDHAITTSANLGMLSSGVLSGDPIYTTNEGYVILPNRQEKIHVRNGSPSIVSSAWPQSSIYDVSTLSNRHGDSVWFKSSVDPSDNTHFRWLSTRAFFIQMGKRKAMKAIQFPHTIRVRRAYLTDANDLWYEEVSDSPVLVLYRVKVQLATAKDGSLPDSSGG